MDSHRKFLQRCLACTILKSKMVRSLTELKVLVYDFSDEAKQLEMPDADYEDMEHTRRAGECTVHAAHKTPRRSRKCQ